MKRICLLYILASVLLTSCGNLRESAASLNADETERTASFSDETVTVSETTSSQISQINAESYSSDNEEDVLDLTDMNTNMVYAQLYDMYCDPQNYAGKTVKIKGSFEYFDNAQTNSNDYVVIITDVTACCAQGLQFIPNEKYGHPEEFLKSGDEVTVSGIFSYYEDDVYIYCSLDNADIIKAQ